MRKIVVIKIEKRNDDAVTVQNILTQYGCCIKTRLGLHDTSDTSCSSEGLVILELTGNTTDQRAMCDALGKLKSVKVKEVEI